LAAPAKGPLRRPLRAADPAPRALRRSHLELMPLESQQPGPGRL